VKRGQNKNPHPKPRNVDLKHTQAKPKKRHKNHLPKKDTKHDTHERDLYRQLETLVQDHIETQLKHRHNSQLPYKRFSRRPSNTDLHILERHKRRIFGLIQTHVEKYIGLSTYTENDHSALFQRNRLRYDTHGGAESSEGRGDKSPHPPLPARHPRSQLSQTKNTSEQQATSQQQETMPSERMHAIRDVQADILSTLKDTSYFNNDTTRAHINSLHVDNFNRLKNTVRQKRVKCERAIRACIDGQLLAPKQTQYKYHYRLFADYHEILHIELDRLLEIAEYMNDQEDIIKFRSDHYREHGFSSIHNRQPTPFVQCYQNVSSSSMASPPKSPTSPVYSPVTKESTNSSSTSSDDSTDDSDSDEDSDSSSDNEDSSPMRSALDAILDL
jgi:hypothetical protein